MHNHGLPVKNLSDDDIANIIYRSAKAARSQRRSMEGKRTETDNSDYSDKSDGNGARFMTAENGRPYYDVPFAESVDAVISGKNIGDNLIFVRNTPEALQSVGIPALPVMITRQHIKDIYNNYAPGGRNAHGMGEQLKLLPQMLEKPVAVIAAEQKNRIIVITQYKDKSGNNIMVPVIIGTNVNSEGNIWVTANIAASAYGKRSVSDMLTAAIEKENSGQIAIFGADKKITSKLPYSGLQLSSGGGFDVVHNIADAGINVKSQIETLQFKKFFKNSKVVDADGKPLVVYHGSSADFTVFDHRFGYRNGAAEGRGFYFTSDKSKAEGYKTENGKLFEVYLRLQKPLAPDELTITKAEVEKIVRAIDTDGIYVSDYAENDIGYPGKIWYNKAVKSAVNVIYDSSDNNADIVAEIYSVFGQGDALAKITEATGYDGFVKGDVYVVFNPTQIKSATDNIGTFDPNNPDIRFTLNSNASEELKRQVKAMQACVGPFLDQDGAEYARRFKEKYGITIDPDEAIVIAQLAISENRSARQKYVAAQNAVNAWAYFKSFNPLFDFIVEFAGENFKLNPGMAFAGDEFTGTFITPEYRKYSVKRRQKPNESDAKYRQYLAKREKALAKVSGTPLDEVAQAYSRESGRELKDVQEEIIDLLRDLQRTDIISQYKYICLDDLETEEALCGDFQIPSKNAVIAAHEILKKKLIRIMKYQGREYYQKLLDKFIAGTGEK